MLTDMIPDKFIGVEVGGIAWEKVQLQPTAQRLYMTSDTSRAMRRMAIDDKKDRPPAARQELLEKGDKPSGVEPPRVDRVPEAASCGDRRDRVDRLALTAGAHHRGLTFGSPRSLQRASD